MKLDQFLLLLIFMDDLVRYGRMVFLYRKQRNNIVIRKLLLKYAGALLYTLGWISTLFVLSPSHIGTKDLYVAIIFTFAVFRSVGAWSFDLYMLPFYAKARVRILVAYCKFLQARYLYQRKNLVIEGSDFTKNTDEGVKTNKHGT